MVHLTAEANRFDSTLVARFALLFGESIDVPLHVKDVEGVHVELEGVDLAGCGLAGHVLR